MHVFAGNVFTRANISNGTARDPTMLGNHFSLWGCFRGEGMGKDQQENEGGIVVI
jgi:hypothetical protein